MPADGYLNFDTQIDTDGFAAGVKNVERQAASFGRSMDNLGSKIKAAFNIAAVVAFTKAAIESAADVKAAGAQFDQTFGELGDAAESAIERVAEPADILETRLKGVATRIYAFAKTAGMESSRAMSFMEDALEVAADSAAYYDRSLEDVSQTLQSFLKGNFENDAALGLSATETTRNAKAMELYGKKFKDLSEAQKQLALLEMVKDANKLSGAMGQAAREADGWENVTGNLSEAWSQFLGVLGRPALKLAVPIVQQMTNALTKMTEWANAAYTAMAQVFGWEEKQADTIKEAAKAQNQLTGAVEETEEAQEGALAGFDEIEVLASGAAKATEETAASAASSATADAEALPDAMREADTSMVDTMVEKLQGLKDFIDTALKPSFLTITDGLRTKFDELKTYIETDLKPAFKAIAPYVYEASEDAMAWLDTNVFAVLEEKFLRKYDLTLDIKAPYDVNRLFGPLMDWMTKDLPALGAAGVEALGETFAAVGDTVRMVFEDVLSLTGPFANSFVESLLPIATQLTTELLLSFSVLVDEVKKVFDLLWTEGIMPALEFISEGWEELCTSFKTAWDEWGAPIFDNLREAFRKTGEIFKNVWTTTLKPIWDNFIAVIDELWHEHLLPLVDSFLSAVGKLVNGALRIYNEVIAPIVNAVVDWLAPVVSSVINDIVSWVGALLGNVIDIVKNIIDSLGGLIDFLVGVFTGDWNMVWQGIKDFFKGIWDAIVNLFKAAVNVLIGVVNLLISVVEGAINLIIGALNAIQIKIPDWVPAFGGKRFGINIPLVNFGRIPYLASGAVIPPNREFLAVLGDQREGVNIETPLETMLEAFRTALREGGGGRGSQTVILMLDKRELGRAVIETGSEEEHRIGVKLVTA